MKPFGNFPINQLQHLTLPTIFYAKNEVRKNGDVLRV